MLTCYVEDIPEEQQEVIKRNYAAQQALCGPRFDPVNVHFGVV